MANDNELIIRINGDAKDFTEELDKVKKKTKELEDVLKDTAKVSAVAFAAFAASIAYVSKEFAAYEKALVGVGKTTDINGKQLQDFGKKFQDMAARIPVATNELLGIAQAAGQLGVKGEANLLKFTETVAKLGVSTDLSGEEAATALTRILTVTGEGVESIDRFGSVIVQLGNNFAATESEIVRVATEVSRSTAVYNVSAAEAAGLSAALKSMGVQAELGGSAVGRAYRAIDASLRQGGAALENLERVTGMTGDQLKKTFAENSTAVFQKFIEGLGRIQANGGDTTATLAAFKLKGEEILKVLPVLAKNSELLGRALGMANAEMVTNTALNNEAARAFATLSSDSQRLQNVFTTFASNIGEKLAPEISKLLTGLTSILDSVNKTDGAFFTMIATLIKWGALITGSLTAVTTAAIGYISLTRIIGMLQVAFNAGRLAIVGFTSAATLGLSVVLAFLPEIISGIAEVFAAFRKKPELSSIDDINRKLDELKDKKDALLAAPDSGFEKKDKQIADLDEQIKKYEELMQAKIRASDNFGDGSVLMRPKADAGGFDPTFGLQAQEIPLAPEGDSAVAKMQKEEDEKTDLLNKAQTKRLEASKATNALLLAETQGKNDKELELEKEYQDIALAERLNANEVNAEIKAQEDANIDLRYEILKEKQRLFNEDQAKQDAEYNAMVLANNDLNEQAKIAQKAKYEAANSKEKEKLLKNERVLNAQRLQNEQELTGSKMQLAQASGEAIIALTGKNALASLALSKGLAVTQVFIDKARADAGALVQSRMLGPGAGDLYLAEALSLNATVFGMSLGTIAAQSITAIAGMNEGGIVPFSPGARRGEDSVPTMLTPGELVVPQENAAEVIEAAASAKYGGGGSSSVGGMTFIVQGDFIGEESFIDKVAEGIYNGIKHRNLQLIPS